MSSTKDTFTKEQTIPSSSISEELRSHERVPRHDPSFVSLREFRARIPELTSVGKRYQRGEITRKEVMDAIQGLNDHLDALRERETEFSERERRGEVTPAERQKEYGLTDEEVEKISNDIDIGMEILSHNIARCKDRSILYRDARGH